MNPLSGTGCAGARPRRSSPVYCMHASPLPDDHFLDICQTPAHVAKIQPATVRTFRIAGTEAALKETAFARSLLRKNQRFGIIVFEQQCCLNFRNGGPFAHFLYSLSAESQVRLSGNTRMLPAACQGSRKGCWPTPKSRSLTLKDQHPIP